MPRRLKMLCMLLTLGAGVAAACSKEEAPPRGGGTGGSAATDGSAGSSGSGGSGGSSATGGTGGSAAGGSGGSSGTAAVGGTGGADGGGTGGVAGEDGGGGTAGADAEPQCTLESGSEACDECIRRFCNTPCRSCEGNAECVAIRDCVNDNCRTGGTLNQTCAAQCISQHPEGTNDFNAIALSCGRNFCGGFCL